MEQPMKTKIKRTGSFTYQGVSPVSWALHESGWVTFLDERRSVAGAIQPSDVLPDEEPEDAVRRIYGGHGMRMGERGGVVYRYQHGHHGYSVSIYNWTGDPVEVTRKAKEDRERAQRAQTAGLSRSLARHFASRCDSCGSLEDRVFRDSWSGMEVCGTCLSRVLPEVTLDPAGEGDNLRELLAGS
jgi:hypothetical protein